MSVKITGRLVTQSGSPSGLEYVIVRNERVRASSEGSMITGESVRVPVEEDGVIYFEAEPGPAVIVVGRESSQYSRYELVPLWIPENDATLAEAFRLGQVHDLDSTSPSVLELIVEAVESSIDGLEYRILDSVEDLIGDIDLEGYATEEWVEERLEEIELTPGPKGDRGPSGKDAEPLIVENTTLDEAGNTIITFSDGNTITVAKGNDGEDGQDGRDGDNADPLTVDSTSYDDAGNTIVTFSDGNTVTVDKGNDGQDGKDGKDGDNADPLTVESTTIDEAGNTVVTFSDGNTITVAKGQDGEDGQDGQNAEPLTVENTTLDESGNTVVTFSDGNTIAVSKGKDGQDGKDAAPLIVEGTTLDSEGNTLVTFSDGNEITVAKGNDGQDGKDAEPLTVTSTTETQDGVELILSDGNTVMIPRGPKGDPGEGGTGDPDAIRVAVVDILNLDPGVLYIDGNSHVSPQNQMRAALSVRGLNYRTVEEIPFDIKLLGVTSLTGLFNGMEKLRKVPLLNTSGVAHMNSMFQYCSSLTEIPSFDTSSVTLMDRMFYECSSLTEIPDLDTIRATRMWNMFYGCSSLNFVPDMYPIVCTNFSNMFYGCSQLTDGNVKLFDAPSNRNTSAMILNSGLTYEPFYESE